MTKRQLQRSPSKDGFPFNENKPFYVVLYRNFACDGENGDPIVLGAYDTMAAAKRRVSFGFRRAVKTWERDRDVMSFEYDDISPLDDLEDFKQARIKWRRSGDYTWFQVYILTVRKGDMNSKFHYNDG